MGSHWLAVIYDPFQDRMWYATKNGGAFCNDIQIHVNDETDLAQAVIASSGPTTNKYVDVPKYDLQSKVFRLMQLSSSQYEAMLVASGKFAGAIYPGFSPHDMAAVKLIIEEAGGKITDLFGNDQSYDQEIRGAVISNGEIHDELLEVINKAQFSSEN